MITEQRKQVLINCSNLHVGGAVAVATSFINRVSVKQSLDFDVSILVSTNVMKNLLELGVNLSAFKKVTVADFIGIKALWGGLSQNISGYDLVFTVFGPAYSMKKINKHIVGFAQPSIIYPESRAFYKVSVIRRVLMRLKFRAQRFFFAKADSFVVELEHVKLGLQRISGFHRKKITVINSAVDSVFSQPDRWVSINSGMEQSPAIKLGLISRNYVHKNLDLLPYIKIALKKKHGIDADIYVTFSPEEWGACSDFFKKNINNVGSLTLAQCPTFYCSLDGVVFPSLLECFSAVPIESMLMGKPLFASDFSFIKDCCKDFANYFVPEDAHSAAAAIANYFAKSPDEQERFIHNAKIFVSSYPSATDRADSYLGLIQRELHD
ncbi:glycosyltransferase [Pseudomonas sp. NFACC42-2]|uniref:glycosyltransferase n=1 Tax=Pseudomonas sp. NFACC42-2 TaxID=1566193 RepID=UPI0008E60E0A|nr:glycosyltransferase [Pseudomonas sp. NFACC42-2]SFS28962.1 Glycosyltransferase involved in cell wall bisynthesis [Pseudomonas sp. NFACC42-2]